MKMTKLQIRKNNKIKYLIKKKTFNYLNKMKIIM